MNERSHVVRSTKIVSLCTASSRLLGFLRMILMANLFGTSIYASAFFLAFQIPNMFRRLFGEGALSAAFVPVFTESLENDGLDEANKLASKVLTALAVVLTGLLAIGFAVIALWSTFFSPDEETAAVLPLLTIMLPYMVFICLVALSMGILNSRRHFFVPAASPIILNVIWISAMVLICPLYSDNASRMVTIVAWSVLLAGVIQLLINIPALIKHGIKIRPNFAWSDERVKKILVLMGPGALGLGVFQINMLIGRMIAFSVADWAVAALQYAELLIYFPLGVFATSLGTVLLPAFSRHATNNDGESMLKTLNFGVKGLMFIMLPSAVGLGVLAEPIIKVFFEHGSFGAASTIFTTRALWFFAPGLVVFSLYKIFVPAFYSLKDTKTPAVVAMIAVAINFLLMVLFVITWPEGYKHAGIAFASVLSSTFNCLVLGILIHRRVGNPGWSDISVSFGKIFIISATMGLFVWAVNSYLGRATGMHGFALLAIDIIAGIGIYSVLAVLFAKDELRHLRSK